MNGDAIHLKPVEIPVGAKAPFTALLLADTHLTLCDARDDERKNALAAARRQGEFRDVERFLREALALVRERRPDLLLHAGDLIDFTSHANFEAAAAVFAEYDFFVCAGARPHPWSSDTTSFVFLSISTLRWYGDPQ